jgi:hypothetical protein
MHSSTTRKQTGMTTTAASRRMARSLTTAIVAVAALAALTSVAEAATPQPPAVPSNIAVGAGHTVFLAAHAVGVQIYSCNATATGYAWGLVAPRADLFNRHGKLIGTHFGGPTWQLKSGSTVTGSVVDRATVDATAIPWLRLAATPTTAGRLKHTTFIQRTATVGGLAPAAGGCNPATVGTRVEVPYTADYYFWKATRA